MRRFGPAACWAATLFAALLAFDAAHAADATCRATRLALVIGNSNYADADGPLREPVGDAREFADAAQRLGFATTEAENLNRDRMRAAIDTFEGKVTADAVVILFFTGFGIQSGGHTYLIPVDAAIWNEQDVKTVGFNLDRVLSELADRGARTRLVIIDGARRNPYERRFRPAGSTGLAAVNGTPGVLAFYSSLPGTTFDEAGGTTSPFVDSLITAMGRPGALAEEAFRHARSEAARALKGSQTPWVSSFLEEDFALAAGDCKETRQATVDATPPKAAATSAASAPPAPAPPVVTAPSPVAAAVPAKPHPVPARPAPSVPPPAPQHVAEGAAIPPAAMTPPLAPPPAPQPTPPQPLPPTTAPPPSATAEPVAAPTPQPPKVAEQPAAPPASPDAAPPPPAPTHPATPTPTAVAALPEKPTPQPEAVPEPAPAAPASPPSKTAELSPPPSAAAAQPQVQTEPRPAPVAEPAGADDVITDRARLDEIKDRLFDRGQDPGEPGSPQMTAAIRVYQRQAGLPVADQPTSRLLWSLRTAALPAPWGAITFAKEAQKWGMAWNADTRRSAIADARARCGSDDCVATISFSGHHCGAFALSPRGWSITWRDDEALARDAALSICKQSGPTCRIIGAVCADGSGRVATTKSP